jgi:hypothetical protein
MNHPVAPDPDVLATERFEDEQALAAEQREHELDLWRRRTALLTPDYPASDDFPGATT